jgi:hypothetical protein
VQDWNLLAFVIQEDWTLVTKNSYDFRGPENARGEGGLYRAVGLHAGLICLNGENMDRQMQEIFLQPYWTPSARRTALSIKAWKQPCLYPAK